MNARNFYLLYIKITISTVIDREMTMQGKPKNSFTEISMIDFIRITNSIRNFIGISR